MFFLPNLAGHSPAEVLLRGVCGMAEVHKTQTTTPWGAVSAEVLVWTVSLSCVRRRGAQDWDIFKQDVQKTLIESLGFRLHF